jgi:DNA-binding transcriptional regulator YiaG
MPTRMSEEAFWTMFWEKVTKTDTCWLWNGAITTAGYGSLTRNRKRYYAHRVVFEKFHGDLMTDECVCHTCDVRNCVAPHHMFRGTKGDNIRDASKKDRIQHGLRHAHAKLDEQAVREIRGIYSSGKVSQHDLAEAYGVSQMTVSKVVRGETWRRVTPPA